jgi:hypothetical protein
LFTRSTTVWNRAREPACGSAWNFDPVTGVIGVQN